MLKNFFKFSIITFIFTLILLPGFSFAQGKDPTVSNQTSGLIPCGTVRYKAGDTAPNGKIIPSEKPRSGSDPETINAYGYLNQPSNPCGFNDLLTLINNFVKFILFVMAVPIAAIMFMYAGFQMVTSGGSTEKAGQARKIFTNAAIGLALAAAAWLIVELILSVLGYSGSWIGF